MAATRYSAPDLRSIRRMDTHGVLQMRARALEEIAKMERSLLRYDEGLTEDLGEDWHLRCQLALNRWSVVPELCDAVLREREHETENNSLHSLLLRMADRVEQLIRADADDEAVGEAFDVAFEALIQSHTRITRYLNGDPL